MARFVIARSERDEATQETASQLLLLNPAFWVATLPFGSLAITSV
jgi:hypothetical protein